MYLSTPIHMSEDFNIRPQQLLGNDYEESPKEGVEISEPSEPSPKPSDHSFGSRTKSSERSERHIL